MPSISSAVLAPPADPAPTPASTISPDLAQQIENVRAALPPASFACRYGNTFCVNGQHPHDPCSSKWLKCHLPGEKNRLVTTLELTIESYEEDKPPLLVLSADGHDAAELTVTEARAAVAAVLDHLPRMLTMIDQYDALLGGA